MTLSKRPLAVTCLVILVLILATTQLLRAWLALSTFGFYRELLGSALPIFLLFSGLAWAALGVWLGEGLRRGAAWAPQAARWGFVAFTAFGWLDRLVLQASGPQAVNWAFQLVGTSLLLVMVFAALALPRAQAFFGENDERPLKARRTK